MGRIEGCASVEVDAPLQVVYAVAADVEGMRAWQPGLVDAYVLESDRAGRQTLVRIETSHGEAVLRFDYPDDRHIAWTQEHGDAAAFDGAWTFEPLGAGRTLFSYGIDLDLGRKGLLVRGPLKAAIEARFIDAIPGHLRDHVATLPTAEAA